MLSYLESALGGVDDLLTAYGPQLMLAAGVLTAAALVIALVKVAKGTQGRRDRIATWVATGMATAFAAEGMYEVATEKLHLAPVVAIGLFAVFEIAMMAQAIQARRMIDQEEPEDPTRQKRAIWVIAAGSGLAAASAGDSLAEWIVRAGIPVLAAFLWQQELHSGRQVERQPTSWRWTPRRLAIRLGALQPGEADLVQVDHERQVEQLVRTAYKRHHGWSKLQTWHGRRLRRLTLAATPETLDEVLDRLGRVYRIEDQTAPNTVADPTRKDTANTASEHPEPSAANTPGRTPRTATANTRCEQPAKPQANPRRNGSANTRTEQIIDELVQVFGAGEELSVSQIEARWGCSRSTASGARNKAKARMAANAEQSGREHPEPSAANTGREQGPNTPTEHPEPPDANTQPNGSANTSDEHEGEG